MCDIDEIRKYSKTLRHFIRRFKNIDDLKIKGQYRLDFDNVEKLNKLYDEFKRFKVILESGFELSLELDVRRGIIDGVFLSDYIKDDKEIHLDLFFDNYTSGEDRMYWEWTSYYVEICGDCKKYEECSKIKRARKIRLNAANKPKNKGCLEYDV